ncbi:Nn.00g087950.m01.CDS01 [Neocucurbitaria sp. VM-36]
MDASAAVEHIAAGIILCLVEMQQSDQDCGWVGHICGAKEVIYAVKKMDPTPGSDEAVIFGWIYYFDTLARFSLRHWRTESIESTALALGFSANGSQLCIMQYIIARDSFAREIPMLSTHAHPLLLLLTEVFETILYASNPRYHTTEYQQFLKELRSKLENCDFDSSKKVSQNDSQRLELIRLASLVYLERVSRNFSGQSAQLESWTKAARSILVRLDTYPCPFALFIFGCESHTDVDRMVLLDLFTRIESKPHIRSLFEVKGLIQSAWIQHDLEVEGTLEYIHKLNLVLSSRESVPSFM